eukprot:167581_1
MYHMDEYSTHKSHTIFQCFEQHYHWINMQYSQKRDALERNIVYEWFYVIKLLSIMMSYVFPFLWLGLSQYLQDEDDIEFNMLDVLIVLHLLLLMHMVKDECDIMLLIWKTMSLSIIIDKLDRKTIIAPTVESIMNTKRNMDKYMVLCDCLPNDIATIVMIYITN